MSHPQLLILVKGLPGCGKSTLAAALARALACPLADKDDARDCFQPLTAAAPQLDWNALSYAVMFRTTERQLSLGLSVVVDCPFARRQLYDEACEIARRVASTTTTTTTTTTNSGSHPTEAGPGLEVEVEAADGPLEAQRGDASEAATAPDTATGAAARSGAATVAAAAAAAPVRQLDSRPAAEQRCGATTAGEAVAAAAAAAATAAAAAAAAAAGGTSAAGVSAATGAAATVVEFEAEAAAAAVAAVGPMAVTAVSEPSAPLPQPPQPLPQPPLLPPAAGGSIPVVLVDVECGDEAVWRRRVEARGAADRGTERGHKPGSWRELRKLMDRWGWVGRYGRYGGSWTWSTDGSVAVPYHVRVCTASSSTQQCVHRLLDFLAARGLRLPPPPPSPPPGTRYSKHATDSPQQQRQHPTEGP
ncbi:hypothetical protein PLESTM_000894000 [Pleodorina starrii]|nr:hypothetical protein PLESTM_000894000 [Pleodorina starrii]